MTRGYRGEGGVDLPFIAQDACFIEAANCLKILTILRGFEGNFDIALINIGDTQVPDCDRLIVAELNPSRFVLSDLDGIRC